MNEGCFVDFHCIHLSCNSIPKTNGNYNSFKWWSRSLLSYTIYIQFDNSYLHSIWNCCVIAFLHRRAAAFDINDSPIYIFEERKMNWISYFIVYRDSHLIKISKLWLPVSFSTLLKHENLPSLCLHSIGLDSSPLPELQNLQSLHKIEFSLALPKKR